MLVDRDWLNRQDACSDEMNRFLKVFPNGLEVNRTTVAALNADEIPHVWIWFLASSFGYQKYKKFEITVHGAYLEGGRIPMTSRQLIEILIDFLPEATDARAD